MFIAVDFDGTIVDHQFPRVGPPAPGAIHWLKVWKKAGATLILWTMRDGDYLADALAFLAEHDIEFDFANEHPQEWSTSPKAYAHTYVDDMAFGCPLRAHPLGGRPYVDWDIVGPAVLHRIEQGEFEQLHALDDE